MPQDDATQLDEILGHRFRDRELLAEALTHPSAGGGRSYERLEFLGDRVLGIVLADLLFKAFPEEPEGDLAKRFAALAQRESLTLVAEAIGLAPFVRMAVSEEQTGGRENPATLADAMEAVIGALYLDGGLEPATAFVRQHWEPLLTSALAPPQDPKTALQEWAQGRGLPLPNYRELRREGPAHDPHFTMEAKVQGHAPAEGAGRSKRAAERAAAAVLLHRLEGGKT